MRKIFLIIFSLTHMLIYSQKSSQKDSSHNKTIDEIVNYGFQDILREGGNLDELKDN